MRTKAILLFIFYTLFIVAVHSQSKDKSKDYQRFRLSAGIGLDWSVGNSNTVLTTPLLPDGFILPFASPGLGVDFNGAYFFTKNYGVGVKYHYYTTREKNETGYSDEIYRNYQKLSFNEKNHFIGPAIFGRWRLFNPKWETTANLGVMYVHHTLSKIERVFDRSLITFEEPNLLPSLSLEDTEHVGWSDFNSSFIGFTASVGICYRITSTFSTGLSFNSFFASLSDMKFDGNSSNISRRMNRIGISAEISVNF